MKESESDSESDRLKNAGDHDQEINMTRDQKNEPNEQCHRNELKHYQETLFSTIQKYAKFGNDSVTDLFENATSSFDLIVANSDCPSFIKQLLHAKQILIDLFILNNNFLLSRLNPGLILKIPFCICLFSIAVLYLYSYIYKKRGIISYDESMEQFIIERNPDLRKNFCQKCKVIKPMRSLHCSYCNICVAKFDFHSNWFNICIAAYNELVYLATMTVIFIYFSVSFILMIYDIFLTNKCAGNELIYHIWLLIFSIIVFKSAYFFYIYIRCLLRNLTQYEYYNQKRLPYLYRDASRDYFNPFDKGNTHNLYEMLFSFLNKDMPVPEPDIQFEIGKEKEKEDELIKINSENYRARDLNAYQQMILLNKPFQPFVSKEGVIYRKIHGVNDIINWNRVRLYTIFDIENNPFKDLLIKQAHVIIDEYKRSLKEESNQTINAQKLD